mgnify:CR=1 FL=1
MIELRNIHASVRHKTLFSADELKFQAGELVALVGKNGSGKSTFLKALAGLDSLVQGEIRLHKKTFKFQNSYFPSQIVSYIPVKIVPFGDISLLDFVLSGKSTSRNFMDIPSFSEQEQALDLLRQFHLEKMALDSFTQLSDGEQKLALIMRSVYRNSEILLLDEPESFLDVGNRKLVFEWLKQLAQSGKTIIFSTHQPDLAAKYVDHFLLIHQENLSMASTNDTERLIERLS